jgi:serine/threonine protein kinase
LLSDSVQDLINKMLAKNSWDRFSAEDCLNHPWFDRVDDLPDVQLSEDVIKNMRDSVH